MGYHQFTALSSNYTQNQPLIKECWTVIETAYSDEERYFHNLSHLSQLLTELTPLQPVVQDWDSLLFAVFYHDVAYDVVQYVLENDNEERSAVIAAGALSGLGFPSEKIELCRQHILATKTHKKTDNTDTNYFTDADLSILGQPWETYHGYIKNIRKEYAIYPDPIYHAGRVKVLKYFLRMERVYKTDHFFQLYENAARENMDRELEILSTL